MNVGCVSILPLLLSAFSASKAVIKILRMMINALIVLNIVKAALMELYVKVVSLALFLDSISVTNPAVKVANNVKLISKFVLNALEDILFSRMEYVQLIYHVIKTLRAFRVLMVMHSQIQVVYSAQY